MRSLFKTIVFIVVIVSIGTIYSCSDDEQAYDPYYDWQARNEAWFLSVTDSARTAIREAKAQWGDAWEAHCKWRQYKTLCQSQDYDTGRYTDSICVRIEKSGDGTYSPKWSDTVRISFRGWMMPTTYRIYDKDNMLVEKELQEVFSQSYYGAFDEETAAPSMSALPPFVQGFSTALQYMVKGDDWYVYVPHQLAYGGTANGVIPAYSTLVWRIHLNAVYYTNTGVPEWKAPVCR